MRNIPKRVDPNDPDAPWNDEPRKESGVEDTRNYGDRGECAVCGKPLDKPPQPEGPQFCDNPDHDLNALREKEERRDDDQTVPRPYDPEKTRE